MAWVLPLGSHFVPGHGKYREDNRTEISVQKAQHSYKKSILILHTWDVPQIKIVYEISELAHFLKKKVQTKQET